MQEILEQLIKINENGCKKANQTVEFNKKPTPPTNHGGGLPG